MRGRDSAPTLMNLGPNLPPASGIVGCGDGYIDLSSAHDITRQMCSGDSSPMCNTLEQAHPYLCQQGRLCCAAQVRWVSTLQSAAAGSGESQLSSEPKVAASGLGGHLSLSLTTTWQMRGCGQLSYSHSLGLPYLHLCQQGQLYRATQEGNRAYRSWVLHL